MTPDAAHHFLVLTYVALGMVFTIFAMRTFAATRRSRRHSGAEGALQSELAEIRTRLASVETMLRDVG